MDAQSYDYDLFVIGAGSGGVRASRFAASMGARVAVAEDTYYGGTCVNVGCVPKKLFAYASEYTKAFKLAKSFGWQVDQPHFHWPTLRDNKTKEIQRLNGIYQNILGNAGVEIYQGHAKILGPHSVQVNNQTYSAKHILITVGGKPRKPTFPGAEHTITSDDAFYLDQLPGKVIVQGGGYIAVEFAGILQGLGCEVELLYRGPLFLRGFDDEVRQFTAEQIRNTGVKLSFNTDIEAVEKQGDTLNVRCTDGETRRADAVFTAIGREPRLDNLGLENTAVTFKPSGHIEVDNNFQTHEPSIFALGDVIGRVELTPVALAEGMALAKYLFAGEAISMNYDNIATAVFCQPNIATVGQTEQALQQRERDTGKKYRVYRSQFRALKLTLSEQQDRCLMKLLVDDETDKVVGAHFVGADVAEMIQAVAVAIQTGATKAMFDATIGVHPTGAEEFVTMREPSQPFVAAKAL